MASTISAGTTTTTALVYSADTSGVLQLQTNGTTTAVTIDTNQNVGIGTSSPTEKLNVFTTATGTTAGSNVVSRFSSNGNGYDANITMGDNVNSSTRIGYLSGNQYFWTNGAERMRIDISGNLLVGTTTQIGSGFVNIKFNSGPNNGITMQDTATSGLGQYIYFINSSSAQAGVISHTGSTTVAYTTSSDYRLKDDVASITGALDKVSALKPVTYKWKEDGSAGEGFIAHELAEVCPQAVIGEKDAVNQDGSIKAQSIDTSFLVATLTAAIQELNAKVTTLQTQVTALKG
jgi:hypothetical protein